MSQLKVEVISNDTVTPSRRTPSVRKTLELSFLDESFPSIHVTSLLIYPDNESTKTPHSNISNVLKASLSETLTHYYPLAGRFENEYTVSCNDEGAPFIVTRVNYQLKDVLDSPNKYDLLTKFYPPEDMLSLGERPISTVIPLAIQVNFFECGGIAIGSYCNHKLLDATSMSSFLNYWAAHASGRYEDLVEPDFDTGVRLFPSISKEKRAQLYATGPAPAGLSQHLNVQIKLAAKSFKFNNDVIKKLKDNAASKTVPNPTRFETVAGFVWKHAMNAIIRNNNDKNEHQPIPTMVTFSASLRSRISPPISMHCIGNITASVHASLGDGEDNCGDHKLEDTVREIHAAVQMTKQKLETMLGENGREIFIAERNASFKDSVKDKASIFIVFSWCKLGLNEVNFGFGKPTKVIPLNKIYPFLRNTLMLVDYSDGIEVYVCLEPNQMPFLEENAEFKAFAESG